MPQERRRTQEITAFLEHVKGLYGEDHLKRREERIVKISYALRTSQELAPQEIGVARDLLEKRRWEELKIFLEELR